MCAKRVLLGTASSLIGVIALTDEGLLLKVMGSSRALELSLAIWRAKDDSGRYPVISGYTHCPILNVVMGWLSEERSLFKIYGLTFEPGLGTYPTLLKVAAVTKGGILTLLISWATRFPTDTEEFAITTIVIKCIAAYTSYHKTSKVFTPMALALKNDLRRLTGNPESEKLGLIITTAMSHASTIHNDLSSIPQKFCDSVHALASSDVYLAEALFPYSGATVHLLIKMAKSDERFYAVGSVFWINKVRDFPYAEPYGHVNLRVFN
ncbi:hypothetical protein MD484_g8117, partial [Candolleomyces efflorescens]